MLCFWLKALSVLLLVNCCGCSLNTDESEARKWLEEYNRLAVDAHNDFFNVRWVYYTNRTRYNWDQLVCMIKS